MNDKLVKLRGCIAAANDIAQKSIAQKDNFDKSKVDELINRIDQLKAKMEEKLAQQPISTK
ncbi:MAG: hypothetical protein AB8G86_08215 [Saprospiraceae bacterium]